MDALRSFGWRPDASDAGLVPPDAPPAGSARGAPRLEVARVLQGALAGAIATAPMTALMEAAFRRLPRDQRYPLPPREIVEQAARHAHAPLPEDEGRRRMLTLAAHFGYGAACGAIYGTLQPGPRAASAGRGTLFGLAVWLTSYLGLLPGVGLLSPATRHPLRRNALMIAAHLVWGAATGIVARALRGRA